MISFKANQPSGCDGSTVRQLYSGMVIKGGKKDQQDPVG